MLPRRSIPGPFIGQQRALEPMREKKSHHDKKSRKIRTVKITAKLETFFLKGRYCGAAGRAAASSITDPQFKSRPR